MFFTSSIDRTHLREVDFKEVLPKSDKETSIYPLVNPFLSPSERIKNKVCFITRTMLTLNFNLIRKAYQDYSTYQNRVTKAGQKVQAVTKIQALFRGYLTRKACLKKCLGEDFSLSHLPTYENTHPFLSKNMLFSMTRAPFGVTPVFMPKGSSHVLKKHKDLVAVKEDAERMKVFCQENGWNHLVVPKAFIYKEFLVAERLPIALQHESQIAFYLTHTKELDSAVRQFTELAEKCWASDLTMRSMPYHCILPFGNVFCPRYDNIPFFRGKNGDCCIGLIDLDHIYPRQKNCITHLLDDQLEDLVNIFPNHLDLIVKYASLNRSIAPTLMDKLKDIKDNTLLFFQRVVGEHFLFLKKIGVTSHNINKPLVVGKKKIKKIKEILEKKWDRTTDFIQKKINVTSLKDPFFEQVFPLLLNELIREVNNVLQRNIQQRGGKKKIVSVGEIIECRRFLEDPNHWKENFMKHPCFKDLSKEMNDLARSHLDTLFAAFAEVGVVARYDPIIHKNTFCLQF